MVGETRTIHLNREDTFLKLAHDFGLGYQELENANPGVDPWLPFEEGARLLLPLRFILPQDRSPGIHINLSEYRLYYFYDNNKVMTFPISIGRGDWQTPHGDMLVTDKLVNPNWYPTAEIRREHELEGDPLPMVVLPGPKNPLGKFALQLNAPGYFIHGTNRPYGIGMKATHGCIRLRPGGIKVLFDKVPRQTPVRIYFDPHRVAVQKGILYLEIDPFRDSAKAEDYSESMTATMKEMIALAKKHKQQIDWNRVIETIQHREGIAWEVSLGVRQQISAMARPTTANQSFFSSISFKNKPLF